MDEHTRDRLQKVTGVSEDFRKAVGQLYNRPRLATHADALRAAFNLTGDEYGQIVSWLGYDGDTVISISAISAIFRRGWLARSLKLSVRELRLMIQLMGCDPFALPNPADHAILQLVALVQALKEGSLKTSAALYLMEPGPERQVDAGRCADQ